ncbi:MAG: hypothetical protein ABIJ09_10065 [Pseudomonadota bacterium]
MMRVLCAPVVALVLLLGACATEKTQVQTASPNATADGTYQQPPAPPAGAPTVLLTDLEGPDAEAMAAHTLFVQRGMREVGRAKIVLKREQDELLAACDSDACLERVRQELGEVRYLASGGVGNLGTTTMVRLRLIEPATGSVVARVLKQGQGPLETLLVEGGRELGQAVPASGGDAATH